MKIKHKLLCVPLICLIFTGCTNVKELEQSVISNNRNTKIIMEKKELNTNNAKKVEKSILNSFFNPAEDIPNDIFYFNTDRATLFTYTEAIGEHVRLQHGIASESTTKIYDGVEVVTEGIDTDIFNYLDSIKEVHYYMDDVTGNITQSFIIRLDQKIMEIDLLWVGGTVYEVKAFNYL